VQNSSTGVVIEAEGQPESIASFIRRIKQQPPPLAVIREVSAEPIPEVGYSEFVIRRSAREQQQLVMISPDVAICHDCRQELFDKKDRRYMYPFINCTNCGPRYTIIRDVPYDRHLTSMASFPMCPSCQTEYDDPGNRRFHAQPNACPDCGPQVQLLDRKGQKVHHDIHQLLGEGKIIAIKGLGAFHLAVDATNAQAVAELRRRKKRDAKPFAVMVKDLATAYEYCFLDKQEEDWLQSPAAPIVVLHSKFNKQLAGSEIHPGLNTLGLMLPYTPLHTLLFNDQIKSLVMTSANISDEPLITDNQEAMQELKDVADYFLVHDREIVNPCDDSVMAVFPQGSPHYIRRARGFVPRGIPIPINTAPVLAVGGDLKNTFCLTRRGEAYLSQPWGDMTQFGNYQRFQVGLERFKRMLDVEPATIALDMHPDYQVSRWARQQTQCKQVEIQHHHAHLAAAMADNGLHQEVLGLICDGAGWGTDKAIWGGEILRGDYQQFQRLGHLNYLPFPGGDQNSRKPVRMALIYLYSVLGEKGWQLVQHYLTDLPRNEQEIIIQQINHSRNWLFTSSCGRLFDAVSAALGICSWNSYEAQAAMQLEALGKPGVSEIYPYSISCNNGVYNMDTGPMWPELMRDRYTDNVPLSIISGKFHKTLAALFTETLIKVREDTGLNQVVLSGGVFHNRLLLSGVLSALHNQGFEVFYHQQVPAGDGGISLGQAVIASEVTARCA
jgi:hydrogenase maturation protein HypF